MELHIFIGDEMLTNSKLTIYHKYYDKESHLDKWKRQVINNVWWFGGKGASYNMGLDNANDVKIRIPKDINDLSNLEISVGDILVKGELEKEISMQSDLKDVEDVYNITSIVDNDFGNNKHLHIEGK